MHRSSRLTIETGAQDGDDSTRAGAVMSGRRPAIKGDIWHGNGRGCGHVCGSALKRDPAQGSITELISLYKSA
jgi:hypothetical protein